MKKTITACLAFPIMAFGVSLAFADPIEGRWKTKSGETARIAKCGGSFCIKLKTGKYKGKSIGKMARKGSEYSGYIVDPDDDKKYSGTASIAGSTLKLTGCAYKIFCKSQNWRRM